MSPLQEASAHLERFLSEMPMAFLAVNRDFEVAFANPECARLIGTEVEDLVGEVIWRFFPEARNGSFHRHAVLALEEQRTVVHEDVYPPCDRWFNVTVYPVGQGLAVYLRETTVDRLAEDAVRESGQWYRRIVETANEGVWMLDGDDRTTFVNRKLTEMIGYGPEELLGSSPRDFVDERDRDVLLGELRRRHGGQRDQYDVRMRHRNGSSIWILVKSTPLMSPGGDYLGALAMVSDISERKRTEEALERSSRDLERTLHELREVDAKRLKLVTRLVNAQEQERRRIAFEIHDDTIQSLAAVGLELESVRRRLPAQDEQAESLERVEERLRRATTGLRQLLMGLMPPELDRGGLTDALEAYLSEMAQGWGVAWRLDSRLATEPPPEAAMVLYRIGVEALANVA